VSADTGGSPGCHPHADRPNWRPGDDDADDLLRQKIADALRDAKDILRALDIMREWNKDGRPPARCEER
jgi:hypothetical protein